MNPVAIHRGMSFGYLAKRGYYASSEGLAQPARMAEMGVTSVALMASVMQDSYSSTRLYQDFEFTPSDHELEHIIDLFHGHGISVMLKPMVECHDSAWRGSITFPDNNQQIQGRRTDYWDPWFESLRRSVAHYGQLAQRTGCEHYCIGCELFAAEQPVHDHRWTPVVEEARSVFSGPICYDAMPQTLDLPEVPAWFRSLDSICVSYYLSASDRPGATLDEMLERLRPSVAHLRSVSEKVGRPIVFGETGCRSVQGAAIVPSEYRTAGPYDPEEQARYADAMCQLFWPEPWWGGFYWWKWDEQQDRPHFRQDPTGDTGWTVQGKPAGEILEQWFARPDRRETPIRTKTAA